MVFQGNPAVYNAAWITLRVSFGATLIASMIGLPLGYFLASTSFSGKGFCTIVLQTLLGFPTVVIGLLVYGFLSRRGPFGFADLLFTPSGIVIGLVVLAFPIVTMFTMHSAMLIIMISARIATVLFKPRSSSEPV